MARLNRSSRPFLSYRHSRRSFLATAAGAGILLPLLRRAEVRAQLGVTTIPRFLVVQRAVGTVRDQWIPSGTPSQTAVGNLVLNPGAGNRPATAVGGVSAGFEPLRTKMTVIDGIDIVASGNAADPEDNGGDQTHEGGMVAVMTGQPTTRVVGQEDHKASGASIDQILLAQSPALQGTAFGSLQLGTDARSDRNEVAPRVMSYLPPAAGAQPAVAGARGPDAQPLFPEVQPLAVYQRLFGNLMAGDVNANADQLAQLRLERGSIIDYLQGDLQRLGTVVPVSERPLIDAHVAAIQSLDSSFNVALDALGAGVRVCEPFEAPQNFTLPANQSGNNPFHEQIGMLQLAIIRTAFACDFARVATFMWSPGTNLVVFGGLYNGMPQEEHHLTSHEPTPEKEHDLVAIERFYIDRTTEALLEFDGIIEPDGSTLLDSTAVTFITEVARGQDHDFANAPFAVIGGANLGIPQERFYRADGTNRPTNDLWLALAPAYGVDLPSLGAAEQWSGPLPDFLI